MSDADTELDLELDDDLDLDGSADAGDGSDAPPSGSPGDDSKNESKRISDLTSKWQKAEARAKKAEEALGKSKGAADGGGTEIPAEIRQWMDAAKDGARERWFNSDPRFAEYGLEVGLIDGAEPPEMQAKAKQLAGLIDSIEGKAREKVLSEFGITPDQVGTGRTQQRDFASMSEEDFLKFVDGRGR